MTLTTVVGSSGSGKTTFLNDLNQHAKSVYIRQYHQIRPYVAVTSIPRFDPTQLPYWEHYQNEDIAHKIPVGGTMAGEFTPGLSGGQRKLLLFELILQRTMHYPEPLLIVLDEIFAGVTDDFVPWIVERLKRLKERHNVVLVTNDHVQVLKKLADNTITVSAVDRTKVRINNLPPVDRQKAMEALAARGGTYKFPQATQSDLKFFVNVEIQNSKTLFSVLAFNVFLFGLFLVSFWNSERSSAAYILIAGDIIAFFAVQPYLLSLVDWRNTIQEEAEALMHSSVPMSKFLKSTLCVLLIFVSCMGVYGVVNAVTDGLESFNYALAIFFDTGSTTFPYICYGMYTSMSHQAVESVAIIPFLFLLFFSTTFAPGAGLPGIKELRYLFSRFYYWCMVEVVKDQMEECPRDPQLNMLLLCITGLGTVLIFIVYFAVKGVLQGHQEAKKQQKGLEMDKEFVMIQRELYGDDNVDDPKKTSILPVSPTNKVPEDTSPSQAEEQKKKGPPLLKEYDC